MTKQRNYKWLEMIESIKNILKEHDDVEIRNLPTSKVYTVSEKFNINYKRYEVELIEYPLAGGVEYTLNVNWSIDNGATRYGTVTVKNIEGKISYRRKNWFKRDENDKPLNSFEIGCKACVVMCKAKEYNKLYKMVNSNYDKIKSIRAYIQNFVSKSFSYSWNDEKLQEIVKKGITLEHMDNNELFNIIMKKYGCNNEQIIESLKNTSRNIDYFLEQCEDNGLFGNDYVKDGYWNYFRVPEELKRELWIKVA